jgi:multicomponent Na+:H+ antiporter subunit E
LVRAVLGLGVVWAGLNGTDTGSWLIGLPTVLIAAALVSRMPRRRRSALRWSGVPPFAVYFLRQSALGGWDVARRVMGRRLTIDPGVVAYRSSLPDGAELHLFLSIISLLPGTLTAQFDGDAVRVHAIDVASDLQSELAVLERRIAGMFAGAGNGS